MSDSILLAFKRSLVCPLFQVYSNNFLLIAIEAEKVSFLSSAQRKGIIINMKVFVTGVAGQLGYDVINELKRRGQEAFGSDITDSADIQLDITDKTAVERVLTEIKPDAVIHCAAWTAVDVAEVEENKERFMLLM